MCGINYLLELIESIRVQPWAGTFSPPLYNFLWSKMKALSIFIDESGDFGSHESHCPYYIVPLLFHNQSIDISKQVLHLKQHIAEAGLEKSHALHSAPLIRREKDYINLDIQTRRKLFRYLLTFLRLCDVKYKPFTFQKRYFADHDLLVSRISREIGQFVKDNFAHFQSFGKIIVYYDGGQKELTNIINVVFNVLIDAEIRRVTPSEYCLFQAVDLACTLELLDLKYRSNTLTTSELEFFRGRRNLYKNNLKTAHLKCWV